MLFLNSLQHNLYLNLTKSFLKTLWKKEKMLVMSNFFSHSVFKRLVSQGRQKVSLCGNGLKEKIIKIKPTFGIKNCTADSFFLFNSLQVYELDCISIVFLPYHLILYQTNNPLTLPPWEKVRENSGK